MFDICVFHGRMRPPHAGHLRVIREALDYAQYVFVTVGSVGEPINFRNPFTFEEVREMIRASLTHVEQDRVFIMGIEDQDTDTRWVAAVQRAVTKQIEALRLTDPKIALIGHQKDGSSYYLKMFPQWSSIAATIPDARLHGMLDATVLRNMLYNIPADINALEVFESWRKDNGTNLFPQGTYLFLREWLTSDRYARMRAEFHFMQDYLDQFPQTPYPRYFTAADACAMMAGHVLLVRRGQMPGIGLWALPGGHVNEDETFQQAVIRELVEETGLNYDPNFLQMACKGEVLLDNPWRSTRKRTISVAYGFDFVGTDLPPVFGQDDAATARWWPIDEVTRDMMFEDHYAVIQHFAARFNSVL